MKSAETATARNIYSGGARKIAKRKLNSTEYAYFSILHSYGKKHGIRYNIVDKLNSPSGRKANAQFNGNSNVISIALDSDQPMLVVAGHETFHYLRDAAPESAKVLQDFVIEKLKASKDFDYDKRFNELSELYGTSDTDVIDEEIAANAMFDVLTNEKAVRELAKNDMTLFEKIKDIIEKIITDLKAELNRYFADKTEARALKDDIEALEQIRTLFDTVLREIEQKNSKTKNTQAENDSSDVVFADKIMYSLQEDLNKFNPENKHIDTILNEILSTSVSFEGKYLYFGRFDADFIEFIKSKDIAIQELPIIMNYRDAYLSMQSKENGIYKSDNVNYHNIGIAGMKSAIS